MPVLIPAAVLLLESALTPSFTARRLLVADAQVPRREAHASSLEFAVDERGGASPEIVVDLERLRALPPGEAQAEYARALARAEIAAPLPLVEAEQAERQWTAQVLVEAAAGDAALSKALLAAQRKAVPRAPILDRAAAFAREFELDPPRAYWSVQSGARGAVSLTALEDLFALRAADIRALKESPRGPYATLGPRRYPGPLARAAFLLRAPGTLERLREALGAYDTVGVEPFRAALKAWRRSLL